jgi:hypothetical protein
MAAGVLIDAAQNPSTAAEAMKDAHPRAWKALTHASGCIRDLARSAAQHVLVGMPPERWSALEGDKQTDLLMMVLHVADTLRKQCGAVILERICAAKPATLAALIPVLSRDILRHTLRAVPDEALAHDALQF